MAVGETIRDVVLRITGDGDNARRELERLALDLTKFGRKEAEADAKINTVKAKADLKALETQFSRIDGRDLTATAKVRLGKAMAELALLQAQVDELDDRDVEIDVNVKKDLADRLQSLGGDAAKFADHLGDVEKRSKGAGDALADTNVNVGNMNTTLGMLVRILPVLIPVIVGFGAQIIALGASAVEAVGGLGALAIAGGGALASAFALGIAAVFRFKETMEEAGTPANRIVGIIGKIGEAASGLSKAADPVLEAIANNLGGVFDVIEKIRPAFFAFGKEAGAAVGWVVKALTSSDMAEGIAKLLELSGPVMKPLAQIMVRFGRILLNIANAAMPFLTQALQGLARTLGQFVKGTSDIDSTRKVVGGLVDQLRSWWHLLVAIGGVFGELVRIAAPFGKAMVDTLAEGAEHLREWLHSSEGTKRVQQFFKDVLPLASEVAKMVGKLIIIFLQMGQLLAPVFKPIVAGINQVLDVIIGLMELLNKIPAPIREVAGVVGFMIAAFGKFKLAGEGVKVAIDLLLASLGILGGAISGIVAAFVDLGGKIVGVGPAIAKAAAEVAQGAVSAVVGASGAALRAGQDLFQKVRAGINSTWSAVVSTASDLITAVVNTIKNAFGAALRAGQDLFQKVKGGINAAWGAVVGAAGDVVSGVIQKIKDAWDNAKNAGETLIEKVKAGITSVAKDVASAAKTVGEGALTALKGLADVFFDAGKALMTSFGKGIASMATDIIGKAKDIAGKVADILPGSEPKDPTSPLRGLKRRGQALVRNLIDGIDDAGPDLVAALSSHLAGVGALGPPSIGLAASAAGVSGTAAMGAAASSWSGGVAAAGGGGTTIDKLIVQPIAGGGSPDPHALAAQLDMLLQLRGG